MQEIEKTIKDRTKQLLDEGVVDRALGWKKGEYGYDNTPAVFFKDDLDGLVYNSFCGANLSKYLIADSKKDGKIMVPLKPCDTYSFNQLVKEHRIDRSKIYVLGIPVSYTHLSMRGPGIPHGRKVRRGVPSGRDGIREKPERGAAPFTKRRKEC